MTISKCCIPSVYTTSSPQPVVVSTPNKQQDYTCIYALRCSNRDPVMALRQY